VNDRNNNRYRIDHGRGRNLLIADPIPTSRKLAAGLIVWLVVFIAAAAVGLVVGRELGWFR